MRDDRLFDLWSTRVREEGEPKMLPFIEDWDEADDFVMNNIRLKLPPGAEWMRKDLISDAFDMLMSTVPSYAANTIKDPGGFRVESTTAPNVGYQYAVHAKIASDRRKARLGERIVPQLTTGLGRGHMLHMSVWQTVLGEKLLPFVSSPAQGPDGEPLSNARRAKIKKVIVHDGPWTEFPDIRRTWFSNGRDLMGNHLWVVQEYETDLAYLRQANREYKDIVGVEVYQGLENAEAGVRYNNESASPAQTFRSPSGTGGGGGFAARESSTARTSGLDDRQLASADAITLRQCWGWVPTAFEGGRNYSDSQWRLQVWTLDGEKLRDVALPTPNVRPPHRHVPFVQFGDEPYGRAAMRWAIGEIQTASELRNLQLAELWVNVLGIRVARRDVGWDFRNLGASPGVVYTYDPEGKELNPADVMAMLPRSGVPPQVFQAIEEARARARTSFGTDLNRQGDNYGQRTTATEADLIESKAGSRVRFQAMLVGALLDQRIIEDYFLLNQTFLSRPAWIRLAKEHGGGRPFTITADQLRWPADFYVRAGEFGAVDRQQVETMLGILERLAVDPEIRERLRVPEMAEDIMYRSQVLNPQRFIKSEEDVMKEREQRAKLAVKTEAAMAASDAVAQMAVGASAGEGADGAEEPAAA